MNRWIRAAAGWVASLPSVSFGLLLHLSWCGGSRRSRSVEPPRVAYRRPKLTGGLPTDLVTSPSSLGRALALVRIGAL